MQSHNENQDNLKGGVQKLDYTTNAATHPNWVAPQIFLQIPRAHGQGYSCLHACLIDLCNEKRVKAFLAPHTWQLKTYE